MKRIIQYLGILSMLLLLSGCINESAGNEENHYSFATSGQGGTFYVAGSGLAAYINNNVNGVQVNAEVTQGVVENVRLMSFDESEMGFAYGSTAYQIKNGLNEFEGHQYDDITAIANIHDGALNFVTLETSGIETIDDLVGRNVSIGPEGSGSAAVAEEFLRSVDLWDEINIQYLGFDDSASNVRDGHLAAFIVGGTSPVPTLLELEATHPMKILPIEQEKTNQFIEDHPYHLQYTIAEDNYTSLSEPVETVGYSVLWVGDGSLDDQDIYDMLESVFSESGRAYLEDVQAAFSEMSSGKERFEAIDLPLHPGAEAFYNDNEDIQ